MCVQDTQPIIPGDFIITVTYKLAIIASYKPLDKQFHLSRQPAIATPVEIVYEYFLVHYPEG